MRLAKVLLVLHIGALMFGLAGLLFVIPRLAEFAANPSAMRVYAWGMAYGGSTHIILGALTMFVFGVAALGWRRTVVFFGFAVPISLCSEILGTTSGYPFGNYAYTNFLGYKVANHVPYSIPLSWFYMGFATYIIGSVIAANRGWHPRWAWGIALGAWFLTVWDLVLDPAMAHADLAVKFWEWSDTGPYFGMPVQNFLGWTITGIIYIGLSRLAWNADLDPAVEPIPVGIPLAVFIANTIFASALSASVGLWIPIILAAVLGILPALTVLQKPKQGATGMPTATLHAQSV